MLRIKKIIVGNWKMNPLTYEEAKDLYLSISAEASKYKNINVVVACPSIFLYGFSLVKESNVLLAAQDGFPGDIGSSTGSISNGMLERIGVQYVILGHSERRTMGETDQSINEKIKSALLKKLKVILCVGESLHDESGDYLNFIKNQLVADLSRIKKDLLRNLIVAYEPIWAIGKDAARPATSDDVSQAAIFIRKVVSEIYGRNIGIKVPVLYGGSVDSKNCSEYLRDGSINGFLVGRASLSAGKFGEIIRITNEL